MSTKTPIEVGDIRKGDLIRYEFEANEFDGRADEYRATDDGHDWICGESGGSTSVPHEWVTAFTPATAVPTSALDGLREHARSAPDPAWGRIQTFLRAIDEANA